MSSYIHTDLESYCSWDLFRKKKYCFHSEAIKIKLEIEVRPISTGL